MDKICKKYLELWIGETCKGENKSCTCSGVKSQCNFPENFEEWVDKQK